MRYRLKSPAYYLFAFVLMFALGAMAADQTYDDTSGDNVWDTSTANWDAGVAWTNGNSAIFGGTGESVAVDTVTANGITFDSAGYTLTGGTITSGGSVTANESATINSAISLNTGQSWSAANGKTLTLGGAVSGGNSLTYGGSGTYIVDGNNTMSENVVIDGATVRVNTGKTLLLSGGGWVKKTVTVQNNGVLEAYEYANGAALWGANRR